MVYSREAREDQIDLWRRVIIMFGMTSIAISVVFTEVLAYTIHSDRLKLARNSSMEYHTDEGDNDAYADNPHGGFIPRSHHINDIQIGTFSSKVFFLITAVNCILIDKYLLLITTRRHLNRLGIWLCFNGFVICMYFIVALMSPFIDGFNMFGIFLISFSVVFRIVGAFCVNELDRLVDY